MSLLEQDSAHHADRAQRKPPASNPNPLWAPFGNRPRTRRRP